MHFGLPVNSRRAACIAGNYQLTIEDWFALLVHDDNIGDAKILASQNNSLCILNDGIGNRRISDHDTVGWPREPQDARPLVSRAM